MESDTPHLDTLESDVLIRIGSIAADATRADGAPPLDEGTWLALHHRPAHEIGWWLADDGFALLIDGDLSLVVRPTVRDHGLGRALIEEVLAVSEGEPLRAWSHADHPGAHALAATYGFERVRDLWVMRRPEALALPEIVVPDGLVVRAFEAGDEAELLRVNAAAFAAHPEQGAMGPANLAARMGEDWWDPAGLLVAVDRSGAMLGFHWTKLHPRVGEEPLVGEVYVVGIAPGTQGRGLGKLLTLAGLHHLASKGVAEVILYVESDNAPAIAVYERLGFAHAAADTHVMYRR
ncbi:mycothiol synthase [Nocardioides pacificus]